ncbi:hypothetical protein [Spiroplasma endosymbiont of Polydrusus pterygomalis]|uniref:hypothetical protein n=1 Tax=Spiroplasma endosymbiont of Polydrusus pterygomalis TaxID=3139327 RepID=UPI003CCA73EB
MENFNYNKKDNYTQEEFDTLLEQHRNFVFKEVKKEFEPKIREYEEKSLFNGLNEKQVTLAKSLLPNYKDLSKSEALNKIKNEYVEIFKNSDNSNNQEDKTQYFNFADLLKLDEVNKLQQEKSLSEKAKTTGITNPEELKEFAKQLFSTIK